MTLILLGIVLIIVGFIAKNANANVNLQRFSSAFKIGGVVIALVGIFISSVRVIEPGKVGVQVVFGNVNDNVLSPGLSIVNPLTKIELFDITLQNYTMSSTETEGALGGEAIRALSADGLEVVIDMTVTYRVDPLKAVAIRKTIGPGYTYVDKVIRPNSRTRIRESASQYPAVELYSSKRDAFQKDIYTTIQKDFETNGVLLQSVLIRNINLPNSVKSAIEAKINAEQDAQKMEFVLQKEEQEANRKRVEAGGIADYQRIINSTLSDKLLQYESIKAIHDISTSENSKVVFVGGEKNGAAVLIGGK